MSTKKSGTAARRWAFGVCLALVMASGCRQILGVEDPVPCESSAACALEGEPCVTAECVDGACVYSQAAAGSPSALDVAGDCSQTVCDESGEAVTTVDADDAPADDTAADCKAPVCTSDGSVGSDVAEADVPADEFVGDCKVPVCNSDGSIGSEISETDVPADTIPDDCKVPACDADGNVVQVDDPNGCDCEVGEQLPCYDGPVGTEKNSPCTGGTAICEEGGTLGECMGQVLPAPDSCFSTSVDEDCGGENNECTGEYVWSHAFGGVDFSAADEAMFLPSNDPFGGDVLTSVGFFGDVEIDGQTISGGVLAESVLVTITRQGDLSIGPHFAAPVEALTRRGALIFGGANMSDGSSEDFGSGAPIAPTGSDDVAVVAFNAVDSTLAWKQQIKGDGDDTVSHLIPRMGGGVVAQGRVRGAVAFATAGPTFTPLSAVDEYLVAYNETGAVDWVTRWPASSYSIADVAVDPDDGNLFVCGSSAAALVVTNSVGVSTTLHAAPTTTDGWAFRVDGMTGNVSTATSAILKIAGAGTETCKAFKILPGGGRVIAGSITQSVTIGAVTLTHTNSVADSFVMTATPSNTPVTSKMFNITTGAVSIASIDVAADGSIVVGGNFQGGSLTIGAAAPIDAPSQRNDLFVAKFSPTLTDLSAAWPRHYFSSTGGSLLMTGLKVAEDFGIVVAGAMTGPFSAGGPNLPYDGDFDGFVFKITQ